MVVGWKASSVGALAFALLGSGCALSPGMAMNEGAYLDRTDGKRGEEEAPGVTLVSITPKVLTQQATRQKSEQRPNVVDPLAGSEATYDYVVAPFDVLSVIVWEHPELTIPAGEFRSPETTGNPVGANGTMFFPHVGVVPVAGKTLGQVREFLTERLARVIEKPQLDVRVVSFRSKKVQITGEVMAPSSLPITDVPLTVQEALALAKGPTPEADLRHVQLVRAGKTLFLDLQSLYDLGDTSSNWLLQPGDVINVPDRTRNRVFVLGELNKPSTRLMNKGRMTLADAIGDTEGFDPTTANPSRIYVIRGTDPAKPTVYKLDASSPDALLLATQFQLQPLDVVFVSATQLTRFNRVMTQVLPTIQALWQTFDLTSRAFP